MKNLSEKDARLAKALLATARRLVAADEEETKEDPKMNEKLRALKPLLTKLNAKRNKSLKQVGVAQNIKTTAKVEDLVDILIKIAT